MSSQMMKNNLKKVKFQNDIGKYIKKKPKDIYFLLPLRKPCENNEGFLLENGKYTNFFEILPQDYPNLSEYTVQSLAASLDLHFRTTTKGFSWFSINMPIDLSANISFVEYKKNMAKKRIYKKILDDENKDMQNTHIQTKQFYFQIFADNYEEMIEQNNIIMQNLAMSGIVKNISMEEKEMIIRKLNNPNS